MKKYRIIQLDVLCEGMKEKDALEAIQTNMSMVLNIVDFIMPWDALEDNEKLLNNFLPQSE